MKNTTKKNALLSTVLLLGIIAYFNLTAIADLVVIDALGLERSTMLGEAVWFFVFEVPKVLLLLTVIVFGVGIIRSFFSAEKTRKALEGKPLFAGNVSAGLLGVVTPFCSCSAVPLFLGFVEAGIPLGVTFSFLIAAPMVNEVALVLLWSLFGAKIALLYASTGLAIAIIAGTIIGKLKIERFVEPWVYEVKVGAGAEDRQMNFADRLDFALDAVKDIVGKVWPYILGGIALGSFIHGYAPDDFLAGVAGRDAWYSVPVSVLLGIPLYSNAAGIIPIIQALLEKGVSLGTALAFMMSVIGLSLPEMIILRKVLRIPALLIFAGTVGVGIMIVGFIFNSIF